MSEGKTLTKQVEEINAKLRAFGPAAVQEIKMLKDGKVIGQVRYGYKPQYKKRVRSFNVSLLCTA